MNSLAQLQQGFQTHVLDNQVSDAFDQTIVGTPEASSGERLNVYANAYRARLVEILGNDFIGLQALTDASQFEALCHHYIAETPSRTYNARWYGARLPVFLRTTAPWSNNLALSEMADLDWAIGLSFDAADEPHISEADVAAMPPSHWPEMHCRLHGSVRRLFHCWNVADIRRALDRGETPPPLRNLRIPQAWIVSRQEHTVRYRAVEGDESDALDAVEQNLSFTDICEQLCEWHAPDVVAMRVASLFKAWIQNQWIKELYWPDGA